MIHRSFANQLSDYQFVAEQIRRAGSSRTRARIRKGTNGDRVLDVVNEMFKHQDELSYFALHKLYFLIEAEALEQTGQRIGSGYIIRQKDGPYCVDLHATRLSGADLPIIFRTKEKRLFARLSQPDLFNLRSTVEPTLSPAEREIVASTMSKHATKSDAELKRTVYLSKWMRAILRMEKLRGINLYNVPLLSPQSTDLD